MRTRENFKLFLFFAREWRRERESEHEREKREMESKQWRERKTHKMDNDDVSDWKNEQWRSSSCIEWENDGWLDSPAGSGKQKNAYENEFVVNSVNCTFISFFLCMNWKKNFFLIHRPTTIVSTIAHRRRLKVIDRDKILSNWFQYKDFFTSREEEKNTSLLLLLLRLRCRIRLMMLVVDWSSVICFSN